MGEAGVSSSSAIKALVAKLEAAVKPLDGAYDLKEAKAAIMTSVDAGRAEARLKSVSYQASLDAAALSCS